MKKIQSVIFVITIIINGSSSLLSMCDNQSKLVTEGINDIKKSNMSNYWTVTEKETIKANIAKQESLKEVLTTLNKRIAPKANASQKEKENAMESIISDIQTFLDLSKMSKEEFESRIDTKIADMGYSEKVQKLKPIMLSKLHYKLNS